MKITLLALIILLNSYNKSISQKTKAKKWPTSYFITNWYQYSMPSEVDAEELKKILDIIGSFTRLQYCPYQEGDDRCKRMPMKQVVKDVIHNTHMQRLKAIAEEEDHKKKMAAQKMCSDPGTNYTNKMSEESKPSNLVSLRVKNDIDSDEKRISDSLLLPVIPNVKTKTDKERNEVTIERLLLDNILRKILRNMLIK